MRWREPGLLLIGVVALFVPACASTGRTATGSGSVEPVVTAPPTIVTPTTVTPTTVTPTTVTLGAPLVVPFTAAAAGDGVLEIEVAAPGTDWGRVGAESAVLVAEVDGRAAADVVVTGAAPITRRFLLGTLMAGDHVLRLGWPADRSSGAATEVQIFARQVSVVAGSDATVLRHAPVLFGRTGLGGVEPFQNATSDTPLLAYHETRPAAVPGHRILTYSMIWSNEDGGTSTALLLSRWGRTTDITWVYEVEVDERGDAVQGTATYQASGHQRTPFTGQREADHPLLETCTLNNIQCLQIGGKMRFFLDPSETLAPGRSREEVMQRHPWTYALTAAEVAREGHVEVPSDPATEAAGDPHTYLFVELSRSTDPVVGATLLGLAVGVRLRGDPRLYTSHHGIVGDTIQHDGATSTAVELPSGTTAGDVEQVDVLRLPAFGVENGARITVSGPVRAFFLGTDDEPGPDLPGLRSATTILDPVKTLAVQWSAGPR